MLGLVPKTVTLTWNAVLFFLIADKNKRNLWNCGDLFENHPTNNCPIIDGFYWHTIDLLISVAQTTKTALFRIFCCSALHDILSTVRTHGCFRLKPLFLNLHQDVLEPLPSSSQTVVRHALHVAVHAEPHVTPAAYPLAVQFNQADDMQHDIPLWSVPLTASLGGSGLVVRVCVCVC